MHVCSTAKGWDASIGVEGDECILVGDWEPGKATNFPSVELFGVTLSIFLGGGPLTRSGAAHGCGHSDARTKLFRVCMRYSYVWGTYEQSEAASHENDEVSPLCPIAPHVYSLSLLNLPKPESMPHAFMPGAVVCLVLSGTEAAILNRESGDSESRDSNRAIPKAR